MKIAKQIFQPFTVISDYKLVFFLWFAFTIISGQLGIIINTVVRYYTNDITFFQSIAIDSSNGNFYTYSIALLASVLGPLFINLIETEPNKFKSIKITTITVSIFLLFFSGIFYSLSATVNKISFDISQSNFKIDKPQLFFYLFAIIIATYTFSLVKLDLNYDKFKGLDDNYKQEDDENVESLISKSKSVNTDNKGNKL